ncbi:MAG: ABC transporter permease [Pseudomonadota bacterium]
MNDITIEPNKTIRNFWRELWEYRELFLFLAWRDILVRYKQTVFGIAWSIIRPVLTMLIFSVVFGTIAKLPSGNIPYPILVYAAMLPWQFFSNTLSESGSSLLNNASMITKVYFPRIIIPSTIMVLNLVDFFISFIVLAVLMLWYGFVPDIKIVILPFLLAFAAMASLGAGYWFSALMVKYRDFRYVVPFVVQLGLYISPVGFSSDIVPEKWRMLYSLNPMVGVIDGFRWALLGNDVNLYLPGFCLSVLLTLILFISGMRFFYKTERTFADII